MDIGIGEYFPRRPHELIHEVIVLLSPDTWLPKTKVQLIVEQFLVLSSH